MIRDNIASFLNYISTIFLCIDSLDMGKKVFSLFNWEAAESQTKVE